MYVDDEIALTVRDMAISKADIDLATKTYEAARAEVMRYMEEHKIDMLTTDEYTVRLRPRNVVTIDRKALEEREPDLFRDISSIKLVQVINITPR